MDVKGASTAIVALTIVCAAVVATRLVYACTAGDRRSALQSSDAF